jgi:hypothetical protein
MIFTRTVLRFEVELRTMNPTVELVLKHKKRI